MCRWFESSRGSNARVDISMKVTNATRRGSRSCLVYPLQDGPAAIKVVGHMGCSYSGLVLSAPTRPTGVQIPHALLSATVAPERWVYGSLQNRLSVRVQQPLNAFLAQRIEHLTTDQEVRGSNPLEGTTRVTARVLGVEEPGKLEEAGEAVLPLRIPPWCNWQHDRFWIC